MLSSFQVCEMFLAFAFHDVSCFFMFLLFLPCFSCLVCFMFSMTIVSASFEQGPKTRHADSELLVNNYKKVAVSNRIAGQQSRT